MGKLFPRSFGITCSERHQFGEPMLCTHFSFTVFYLSSNARTLTAVLLPIRSLLSVKHLAHLAYLYTLDENQTRHELDHDPPHLHFPLFPTVELQPGPYVLAHTPHHGAPLAVLGPNRTYHGLHVAGSRRHVQRPRFHTRGKVIEHVRRHLRGTQRKRRVSFRHNIK